MMALAIVTSPAWSETRTSTVKPQYLPPAELARALGVREREGRDVLEWRTSDAVHVVDVRRNDGANLFVLSGSPEDVDAVEAMVKAFDVPPHQITIEAQIVEVDRNRVSDLGFDWGQITATIGGRATEASQFRKTTDDYGPNQVYTNRDKRHDRLTELRATADLFGNLRMLEQSGAATFRDAPRILTMNNRRATILDGQRVTYITRYSSFTNLFVTDTLDAGLTLSVLPSLGESGYLTLDVRAELTSLAGDISGSPIKDGQIVENMVVVENGETVVLGGFQRTSEQKTRRNFPLLGRLVPFLFSRESVTHSQRESFIALTPRVVDLAAGVDDRTREMLQGGATPEKK